MHALLMLRFVGCALTGLPLLFADKPWAATLARMLGGFRRPASFTASARSSWSSSSWATCSISRGALSPAVTFDAYSGARTRWSRSRRTPIDMYRNFKWFLGLGPRPQFDRWTYWEKFDYWAVFWGMFIIGGSGLLLWFPVFFSTFLPGWMFNIATLVHGEEALLAVGFIFTIHFFNGHLRPEKFPMDTVIFTGRISEHELKHERAVEYERLLREGRLAAKRSAAADARVARRSAGSSAARRWRSASSRSC